MVGRSDCNVVERQRRQLQLQWIGNVYSDALFLGIDWLCQLISLRSRGGLMCCHVKL